MGARKHYINENYFNTWSSNMAYILGFITADGYVRKYEIVIGLHPKDIEILEFIRSEIGSTHLIKIQKIFDSRTNKYYDRATLAMSSKKLCDILQYKFGIIQAKTGKENICFNIPEEFKYDYIRGLFDGDGHVAIQNNSIKGHISSASIIFLEQIKNICNNIGRIVKDPSVNRLILNRDDLLSLSEYIYSNKNSFRLKRKFDIFMKYKSIFKHNAYKEKEIEIIKQYCPHWSKISFITGRTVHSIRSKAVQIGIWTKGLWYTDNEEKYIIENYDPNNSINSIKQIANELNKDYRYLSVKLKKMGLKQSRNLCKYDREIVLKYKDEKTPKEIGKMINRSARQVYQMIRKINQKLRA